MRYVPKLSTRSKQNRGNFDPAIGKLNLDTFRDTNTKRVDNSEVVQLGRPALLRHTEKLGALDDIGKQRSRRESVITETRKSSRIRHEILESKDPVTRLFHP